MTTLDVLLVEASPGDGAVDASLLEEAGHRVHRCFDGDTVAVHPSGWKPCVALTEGTCPLDERVDVALLVRRGVSPRPGPTEAGLRCVVRAGVPLVEDGGDVLDPFAEWVDRRTDRDGVVDACQAAHRDSMAPVTARLRQLCASLLEQAGVDPADITVRVTRQDTALHALILGPPLPHRTQRALCTRLVDAIRVVPRRHDRLDVTYEVADPALPPI